MNKVIVAGSINRDIVVLTQRHPKLGESVIGEDVQFFPGGKGANQAIAAAKLGVKTIFVGKVGEDEAGSQLTTFIQDQGVEIIINTSDAPTGTALITVNSQTGDNTIVGILGANMQLSDQDLKPLKIHQGDILVSQCEIPDHTVQAFFQHGRKAGAINILNAAPAKSLHKQLLDLINILIVNETELEILSGQMVDINHEPSIIKAIQSIGKSNLTIIVTLGELGLLAYIQNKPIRIPGKKVTAVDTTGAGDCFVGAIAAQLASHADLMQALEFANHAASICVTKAGAGTSMPTLTEVSNC